VVRFWVKGLVRAHGADGAPRIVLVDKVSVRTRMIAAKQGIVSGIDPGPGLIELLGSG